jgi:long-chain acyl-CoA synthetase
MAFDTLQQRIRHLADHGDKPAIVTFYKERTETLPFAELARTVRRLGAGLAASGLRPGEAVALLGPNGPEWVAACFALIRAGLVPVPMDAQMGDDDLRHVLSDSEVRRIFTTRAGFRRVERAVPESRAEPILWDADPDDPRNWQRLWSDTEPVLPEAAPEDTAVLFYTSGTTGAPKGVPLSHRNLASNLEALLDLNLLEPRDRFLLPLPLHHVYPFTIGLLAPLASGLPIIFPASLTGPELLRALAEGQATILLGVPRMYEALYTAIETRVRQRGKLAERLFHGALAASTGLQPFGLDPGKILFAPLRRQLGPQLRLLLSGGAALDPELARKFEGLGFQWASGYGLTETSPVLAFNRPGKSRLDTAGQPLPGVDIRIAEPVPPAEQGEVQAKGPNVFAGYRHLPERTAGAFTADGWFRTGDLGRLDDGFLKLTGRASEMIVLPGGENIRPEFVEEILCRGTHVKEAAVLERNGRLVALLVPAPAATREGGDPAALLRRDLGEASQKLPSHHRPADWAVTPDPLPRTQLGKLKRHQLAERYEQAKQAGRAGAGTVGPLPIERMAPEDRQLLENPAALALWQWLAGRFREVRLTPDTHLQLDLGVDSLEWLSLTLEMGETTGVTLDPETIGRVQTVRDLLREVSEAGEWPAGGMPDLLERLANPETLLDAEQLRWAEPPKGWMAGFGNWVLRFDRWLMAWAFSLKAEGLENLPEQGPFVLTPNHLSYLDPMAIVALLPDEMRRRTCWAGFVGVMFRNAFMRMMSRVLRVLPVDPARGPLGSVALGVLVLKRGEVLAWFPESGRSPTGELRRFESGIGLLLRAEDVPAVPVRIVGTYEALPKGGRWPRFVPVTVRFGPPARAGELEREGRGDRPEARIAEALHDRVANL